MGLPVSGGLVDFALGAALIILPQYKIPLAAGAATIALGKRLKERKSVEAKQKGSSSTSETEKIELQWTELTCTITDKKGRSKTLLDGLQGQALPGRLLSIMGPSGSGKTTLLNALAGQVPQTKRMALKGNISINGEPQQSAARRQGYVQQDDIFFSQMTVRETLSMAAALRMPRTSTPEDRSAAVDSLMAKLGLTQSADTIIGNAKTRGLSGGEKKRLSIACELISSPRLLFLDEPTSGLDSFQAEKVMQTLKQLAEEGHTVVCSIHQPRSSIYAMFDDLLLLSEGRLVYAGAADQALKHFEQEGHACPQHYNPADFLADLVSVDHSSSDQERLSRERVGKLQAAPRASVTLHQGSQHNTASQNSAAPEPGRGASLGLQSRLLLRRSWRQIVRDKATNVSRAMSNVSSALIFGSIYWRLGRSQISIQDRMGLLQVAAVNAAMSSLTKTLNVFSVERSIVARERSKGSYGVTPYFLAKLAAESPIGALFPLLFGSIVYPAAGLNQKLSRFATFLGILTLESFTSSSLGLAVGAVAPSPDAAMAIGPGVMVLFIVFGGFYVNSATVPRVLRWVPRASLIQHAFRGLCVNEFQGLEFEQSKAGAKGEAGTGEEALQRLTFQDLTVRSTLAAQARVLAFNYWFTYCVLKARRPRFQQLESPGHA
ncbi:hypothetical protein WJX73_003742 [Symbiochloris irregularis]|uniref:ABC transporter domain-containing protein n=1 Tax=Symbiochloris irregularis TaxID=706552 RepID=A0AAW1NUD8_9CHLO